MRKYGLIFLIVLFSCKSDKKDGIEVTITIDATNRLVKLKYINYTNINYFLFPSLLKVYDKNDKFYYNYLGKDPSVRNILYKGLIDVKLNDSIEYYSIIAACLGGKYKTYSSFISFETCVEDAKIQMREPSFDSLDIFPRFVLLPRGDSAICIAALENCMDGDTVIFKAVSVYNNPKYLLPKRHAVMMEEFYKLTQHTGFYLYRGNIKNDSVWVRF